MPYSSGLLGGSAAFAHVIKFNDLAFETKRITKSR